MEIKEYQRMSHGNGSRDKEEEDAASEKLEVPANNERMDDSFEGEVADTELNS